MTSARKHSIHGAAALAVAGTASQRAPPLPRDSQSFENDRARPLPRGRRRFGSPATTKPGGKAYAGGVALQPPFGRWSRPNIRPARRDGAGIGAWTDDEFVAALHEGRGRDGIRPFRQCRNPAYNQDDALGCARRSAPICRRSSRHPTRLSRTSLPFPLKPPFQHGGVERAEFNPAAWSLTRRNPPEWNRGRYLVDAAWPLRHLPYRQKTLLGADKESRISGRRNAGKDGLRRTSELIPAKGIGSWSFVRNCRLSQDRRQPRRDRNRRHDRGDRAFLLEHDGRRPEGNRGLS